MNANGSVGTELMVFMTLLLAQYSDCCHHPLGSRSSLVHCHHHYHYSTQSKWPVDDQICPNQASQKCTGFWVRHSPEAHSYWDFGTCDTNQIAMYSCLSALFLLLHTPLFSGNQVDQDSGKDKICQETKIAISPFIRASTYTTTLQTPKICWLGGKKRVGSK